MANAPLIDQSLCPLCKKANICAMELAKSTGLPQAPCWCTEVAFSADLLARIPPANQVMACVCAQCAALDAKA
jgi:hypothetical protein